MITVAYRCYKLPLMMASSLKLLFGWLGQWIYASARRAWRLAAANVFLFWANFADGAPSGSLDLRAEVAHNLLDLGASLSAQVPRALSHWKIREFPCSLTRSGSPHGGGYCRMKTVYPVHSPKDPVNWILRYCYFRRSASFSSTACTSSLSSAR